MTTNWIAFIPLDGEPYVNVGDEPHFALLEEGMPEMRAEINTLASGHLPRSSQGVFAKGEITPGGYVKFDDAMGDRNIISDAVYNFVARGKTSSVRLSAIGSPEDAIREITKLLSGKQFKQGLAKAIVQAGARNGDFPNELRELYGKTDIPSIEDLAEHGASFMISAFSRMPESHFSIPFVLEKNEILSRADIEKYVDTYAPIADSVFSLLMDYHSTDYENWFRMGILSKEAYERISDDRDVEKAVRDNLLFWAQHVIALRVDMDSDIDKEIDLDDLATRLDTSFSLNWNADVGSLGLPQLPESIKIRSRDKAATKDGVIFRSAKLWDANEKIEGRGGYPSWFKFAELLVQKVKEGTISKDILLYWFGIRISAFSISEDESVAVGFPDDSRSDFERLARAISQWDFLQRYKISDKFDSDPGNRKVPVKDRLVSLPKEAIDQIRTDPFLHLSQSETGYISYVSTQSVAQEISRYIGRMDIGESPVSAARLIVSHNQHKNNIRYVANTFGLGGEPVELPPDPEGIRDSSWEVYELKTLDDLKAEGACLSHCIGDGQYYLTYVQQGNGAHFSFRKDGIPMATLTVGKAEEDGETEYGLHQLKSFSNGAPPFEATKTIKDFFDLVDMQTPGRSSVVVRNDEGEGVSLSRQEAFARFLSGDRELYDSVASGWSWTDGPDPDAMFERRPDIDVLGRYVYADFIPKSTEAADVLEFFYTVDLGRFAKALVASAEGVLDPELSGIDRLPRRTTITDIRPKFIRCLQEAVRYSDAAKQDLIYVFIKTLEDHEDVRIALEDYLDSVYGNIASDYIFPMDFDPIIDLAKEEQQLQLGEDYISTKDSVISLLTEITGTPDWQPIRADEEEFDKFCSQIAETIGAVAFDSFDSYSENNFLRNDLRNEENKTASKAFANALIQPVKLKLAAGFNNVVQAKQLQKQLDESDVKKNGDTEIEQIYSDKNAIAYLLLSHNAALAEEAREFGALSTASYGAFSEGKKDFTEAIGPYNYLYFNEMIAQLCKNNELDYEELNNFGLTVLSNLKDFLVGLVSEDSLMTSLGYKKETAQWDLEIPSYYEHPEHSQYAIGIPIEYLSVYRSEYTSSPTVARKFSIINDVNLSNISNNLEPLIDSDPAIDFYDFLRSGIGVTLKNGYSAKSVPANQIATESLASELEARREFEQRPLPGFYEIEMPEWLRGGFNLSPATQLQEIIEEAESEAFRLNKVAILRSPQSKIKGVYAALNSYRPGRGNLATSDFFYNAKNRITASGINLLEEELLPYGYDESIFDYQNDESFKTFVNNFLFAEERGTRDRIIDFLSIAGRLGLGGYPLSRIFNMEINDPQMALEAQSILAEFGLTAPQLSVDKIKKNNILRNTSYFITEEAGVDKERDDETVDEKLRAIADYSEKKILEYLDQDNDALFELMIPRIKMNTDAIRSISEMYPDISISLSELEEKIIARNDAFKSWANAPANSGLNPIRPYTQNQFTPMSGETVGERNAFILKLISEGITQYAIQDESSFGDVWIDKPEGWNECQACSGSGVEGSIETLKQQAMDGTIVFPITLCENCGGLSYVASCGGCENTGRCQECEGSGREKCPDCDYDGEIRCDECDGHGNFTNSCFNCEGTGEIDGEPCEECGGEGMITEDCEWCSEGWQKCEKCDGSAYIDCTECNGEGDCPDCESGLLENAPIVEPSQRNIGEENISSGKSEQVLAVPSGEVACTTCQGYGYLESPEGNLLCPSCNGKGYRSEWANDTQQENAQEQQWQQEVERPDAPIEQIPDAALALGEEQQQQQHEINAMLQFIPNEFQRNRIRANLVDRNIRTVEDYANTHNEDIRAWFGQPDAVALFNAYNSYRQRNE